MRFCHFKSNFATLDSGGMESANEVLKDAVKIQKELNLEQGYTAKAVHLNFRNQFFQKIRNIKLVLILS